MKKYFLILSLVIIFCLDVEGQTWEDLGDSVKIYFDKNDYNKSLIFARKNLIIIKDRFGELDSNFTSILNNLGAIFFNLHNNDSSLFYFKKSLNINKQIYKIDNYKISNDLGWIGNVYYTIGNYDEAEKYYLDVLIIDKHLYGNDNIILAGDLNNLGLIFLNQNKLIEAGEYFEQALDFYQELKSYDSLDYASCVNNMALYYDCIDSFDEAELFYKKALSIEINLNSDNNSNIAKTITNLGMLYLKFGIYLKAEKLLIEGLEIFRRISNCNTPELVTSINNLALCYEKQGRLIEAERLYKEALEISRRLFKGDNLDLAITISNLANLYSTLENYEEALLLYKEAFDILKNVFNEAHPVMAKIVNNIALLYYKTDSYKEAEQILKGAIKIYRIINKSNNPNLAISLINLAIFYSSQHIFTEVEKLCIEALNIYQKYFLNNISYMSDNEKEMFWNTINYYFTFFNSFVSKYYQTKPEIACKAYDNCLFTKALLLSSTKKVRDRILDSEDSSLITTFNSWLDKRNYLSRLYSKTKQELEQFGVNLDSLENYANDLEKELSLKSEAFANEYDKKQITWKDVQSKLKDGEAAIELVQFNFFNKNWTDTVYYAALIITKDTKEHPELVLFGNGNELDSAYIYEYDRLMLDTNGYLKDDGELYKQYWKPIKEKLKGINKVYLSLDGVYNKINLETILNPVTKEYLADEINIQIVTSTRDILTVKPVNQNREKIAYLFGRPNYNLGEEKQMQLASALRTGERQIFSDRLRADLERTTATDLPGTEKEVFNIKNIMNEKGWNAKVFTGDSALEEEVKAIDNPNVLHIATHGFFFSDIEIVERNINSEGFIKPKVFGMETFKAYENPLLRSGLLFAGSQRSLDGKEDSKSNIDNGILTAFEAMNLKLDNTELVVLSACQTGQGEVRNGEGVYGLQRAFIQAGAKTLIMSLWKVNDEATQELMTSFYTKWLSGKTKREAFKEAQLELRAKYKYPYYWGAFVMVGE